MNLPLVSIVILNWNGIADTEECLKSIKDLTYPNYEVVVIDNGSTDQSLERLKAIPNIKLVALPRNTGFTGGHIEGLKHSEGEYIALLNNDLAVDPEWLSALVACAQENLADIVGGRSYEWDDSQPAFNTENSFSSYQVVSPVTGHTTMLKRGDKVTDANNLSGSNLLVSRHLINSIGYLDASFFAYYEETDLIARAKRAGFRAVYCPEARVWHKSGASSRNNPFFYFYQMHRNRFRFAYKNYDGPELRTFLNYYTKEVFGAIKRRSKSKNDHDSAMIQAYLTNIIALPSLIAKRHKTLSLGKSYSTLLTKPSEGFDDLTIIVPCYNYSAYVCEALDSIELQSKMPTEVIIINDGSTDNSKEVIEKYLAKHAKSPIKYRFIDKSNEGVIATKNLALTEVSTNYMMFLDADDMLDKNYVEKTLKTIRYDNSDIVYTDMEMFGSISTVQKTRPFSKYLIRSVNFIHNSSLMRTEVFKQVGGYKQKMSIGFEDWELYLSISEITDKFSYIPEPLLRYRRHDNASRDISAQSKLPQVVANLEELHPKLYNLRFYYWLESYRLKNALVELVKYPFKLARHTKSHAVKKLRSHPDAAVSKVVLGAHSKLNKDRK